MFSKLPTAQAIAAGISLCLVLATLSPGIAAACEGSGEEGGEEFVSFIFSANTLVWKSGETGGKLVQIKLGPESEPVKLIKQKTNDETDFETKDPRGCMGKTLTEPCSVEIKRKTTAKPSPKWYQFEYEDEVTHRDSNDLTAVSLEGR